MDGVAQLNIIDGALNERMQRALGIYFHTFDIWCKSGGRIDYTGRTCHARLVQDAMTFAGPGNPVATRHGDLAAAHLAIDYSDTAMRLKAVGATPLATNVSDLIGKCPDLAELSAEMEKRVGLFMDMLGKRKMLVP